MVRNSDLSPYLCIREGEIWTLSKPEYPSTAKFRNGYFSDALLLFLFFFWRRFWPRPRPFPAHAHATNIVSRPNFDLETNSTHQNVRNGHIYLQVMKQYMP